MKRSLYPDECPVFEVLPGALVSGLFVIGEHVECFLLGPEETGLSRLRVSCPRYDAVRGYPFADCEVRPLTPAAVEMLALVSTPATSSASRGPRKA